MPTPPNPPAACLRPVQGCPKVRSFAVGGVRPVLSELDERPACAALPRPQRQRRRERATDMDIVATALALPPALAFPSALSEASLLSRRLRRSVR